jgi:hypothetical protein
MRSLTVSDAAKAVVRRNTEEVLWGLISVGAPLLPAAIAKWNRQVINVVRLRWSAAGALLVLFSAMNYFTHIGLLVNTSDSF